MAIRPTNIFGGGSGPSGAARANAGLTYTATGLKPGSTAILYGNGTQIASVTVDGTGKATWTLGTAPAAGTIITYDGVVVGSGGTAPTPVVALGPTTASFTAGAASGSLIATITGLSSGETVSSVAPNDGRVAISSGSALVVGLTASSAGTISYTVKTSVGRTLTVAVTAIAAASITGIVAVGDSITYGFVAAGQISPTYPQALATTSGHAVLNQGVSGRTLATMDANYVSEVAPQFGSTYNAVLILGGVNDLFGGGTQAALQTSIQSFCAKARATGFNISVATLTPVADANWTTAMGNIRTAYNTWLRANYSTFADKLIDFDAIGLDPNDATYFSDKLHPTVAGAMELARQARLGFGLPAAPDTTAPTITSAATATVSVGAAFSRILTANERVAWSKLGGADAAAFTLSGATLGLPIQGAAGTKVVTVRATDDAGNTTDQTVTITEQAAANPNPNLITVPITDASWTKTNTTVSGNNVTEQAVFGDKLLACPTITTSAQAYTMGVDVKAIGAEQWMYIQTQDNSFTARRAWFDLINGVWGTVDVNLTKDTPTVNPDGSYHLVLHVTEAANNYRPITIGLVRADGSSSGSSFSGDVTRGVTVLNPVFKAGTYL